MDHRLLRDRGRGGLELVALAGDQEKTYDESLRLMLKAVALYRDGSKLSQPLNASTESGELADAVASGGAPCSSRYCTPTCFHSAYS